MAFHREEAPFLFRMSWASRGDLHCDVRQAPNTLDAHLIGADAAPVEGLQLGRVQAVGRVDGEGLV
jgi:polyisoprenoid-binding protein YceI